LLQHSLSQSRSPDAAAQTNFKGGKGAKIFLPPLRNAKIFNSSQLSPTAREINFDENQKLHSAYGGKRHSHLQYGPTLAENSSQQQPMSEFLQHLNHAKTMQGSAFA
jgi:hypothetical protein